MKYVFYFELIFIYDTIKVTHSLLTNIAIKNTCCIFLIDDSLETRPVHRNDRFLPNKSQQKQ